MANVSSSNSQGVRVPKLRFPGFEGEWKSKSLGMLGSFTKGAPLSKADITESGTPFILYGELYTTYGEVTTSIARTTDKTADKEQYSQIGDVIIPTSGETPEEIATATCVMVPDVILAGDLNIYRTKAVDGRIISYIINHVINGDVSRIAQGKSVVHIKIDELSKISINYPLPNEQQKLIDFLLLIDERIEKQRQLIEYLKLYKRGLLSTVFNSIEETIPLHNICDYISSSRTMTEIENIYSGNYPVYDAGGITKFINEYDIDTEYIAIIKDGSGVGRLQLCRSKSSFIGTLGGLVPKNCSLYYLYSALQNVDFKNFITGMAIPHIYWKEYKNIAIPFPNNKTIDIIGNTFKFLDALINTNERKYQYLQKVKKALLQQIFI